MPVLHQLNLRQKMLLLIGLLALSVAVLAFGQWRLNEAEQDITQAQQQRYEAYQLADELRQSSDDLTRLVRTYVVTRNERWREQYQQVVAIRAGKQARPAGYEGIYWDLRAADMAVPGQPGEAIALQDMMQRAGFSSAELAKLAQADQLSSALVQLETQAMQLVQGNPSQADQERARDLVHNAEYHQKKAQIMQPVNEFFHLLDARTQGAVKAAQGNARQWLLILVISSAMVLGLFFLLLVAIFNTIIASMRQAVQVMDAVASGDLT